MAFLIAFVCGRRSLTKTTPIQELSE